MIDICGSGAEPTNMTQSYSEHPQDPMVDPRVPDSIAALVVCPIPKHTHIYIIYIYG